MTFNSNYIRKSTTAELIEEFKLYNRTPFMEILADLIQAAPTIEAIQKFAEEHPDRWAGAVKTLANLSGFHDKREIVGNINVTIGDLSDSQLQDRLAELNEKIIDITPEAHDPDAAIKVIEAKKEGT